MPFETQTWRKRQDAETSETYQKQFNPAEVETKSKAEPKTRSSVHLKMHTRSI